MDTVTIPGIPHLRLYLLATAVVLAIWVLARSFAKRYPHPLPPSPPAEPLIGHLRTVPLENAHLVHMRYAKEYNSPLVYFNILGNHIVVLNTNKAATDLLDRRVTLTFMRYGAQWKMHRTVLQNNFTKSSIVKYQYIQEQEARQAVSSIVRDPPQWLLFTRRFASAVVLRIGFGVTIQRDDDPYIQIAADANLATSKGGNPGTALVDYAPWTRFLPDWVINSITLRHAREWSWAIRRLHDVPFAAVLKEFDAGTSKPSVATTLLTKHAENEKQGLPNEFALADIQGASASVFIAGSNTTWGTTTVCIFNLMQNPAVFQKARAEIDRVVGTDRLPSLADRAQLRYLDYIVEEVSRWRPLSPIGIPHRSTQDDVYNDMFIPRGTYVYYNSYAMSRDPSIYRDAEAFSPDRYMPKEEGGAGEPFLSAPFGFGRRICVGRHLAQASVWIFAATLIATMDISKPADAEGKEREQHLKFSTGLSSHPGYFDLAFRPRSEKAKALLAQTMY
ncbi:hypothetical protein LTR85_000061 [Meristemomyces frigidus]|nr:hypothetical protein LTR85_000061 [Meristemomyces frigidus]